MLRIVGHIGALALLFFCASQASADAVMSTSNRPSEALHNLAVERAAARLDRAARAGSLPVRALEAPKPRPIRLSLEERMASLLGPSPEAAAVVADERPQVVQASLPMTLDNQPARIEYSWAWVDSLPRASGGAAWKCLSEAIYHEARGEDVKGQFAVAEVIMNRARSRLWPQTVCGVVQQGKGRYLRCQFTYACDGIPDSIRDAKAYYRAGKIAKLMLTGGARVLTEGATHYHTHAVKPRWSRVFPRVASIGYHYFYRQPRS